MRFAYADPPYLGMSATFYSDHPDHAVYDTIEGHRALIERMCAEYDGWAYSLSSTTIAQLAPIFPPDARWAAWVKPWASFKPGVNPAYAWEPIVFSGSRKRTRTERTVRDWTAAAAAVKRGFIGAKPDDLVFWIIDLLGVRREDEFDDLFPGSGAVTRAIEAWRARPELPMMTPPENGVLDLAT